MHMSIGVYCALDTKQKDRLCSSIQFFALDFFWSFNSVMFQNMFVYMNLVLLFAPLLFLQCSQALVVSLNSNLVLANLHFNLACVCGA